MYSKESSLYILSYKKKLPKYIAYFKGYLLYIIPKKTSKTPFGLFNRVGTRKYLKYKIKTYEIIIIFIVLISGEQI
jgi:hypothetical protein